VRLTYSSLLEAISVISLFGVRNQIDCERNGTGELFFWKGPERDGSLREGTLADVHWTRNFLARNLAHRRNDQRKANKQYVAAFTIAVTHLDLRDKNKALEWLDKAYEERSTTLLFNRV